jgi:hypothetical protein
VIDGGRRRASTRDDGSTTLTTVLLTPVFVVIALAAFQAAMWSHARTEARAVARDAAALVARSGQPSAVVEASSEAALRDSAALRDPEVVVTLQGTFVTARVTARAPGIVRGTSSSVDVTEALPIEGFRP